MRLRVLAMVACVVVVAAGCDGELTEQLKHVQALLQSPEFAGEMAAHLDAAYYRGIGQTPPPFLTPAEETATTRKSVKEEKIAVNLAGFYALEAGVGVISERTKEMPLDVLDSVARGTRSDQDMLLLARFANATWKAGQPFRALSRITRPNFRPAVLLTDDDLQKDYVQIRAAARKVGATLAAARSLNRAEQLARLRALLQSPAFAEEIAGYLDAAYYGGQRQTPPPFLKPEEETATVQKPAREEKIAINLAGFYAVEVGGGWLAERRRELPVAALTSIATGTRPRDEMLLLARFANATWKAGHPFRSLSRIARPNFIPAAMLTDEELQKDFDQIKAAAAKLLEAMNRK